VRTVGVDLSAEPKRTAVAALAWSAGGARVLDVRLGADDAGVLEAVRGSERAALDCPLGWPEPFVDFVVAHRRAHVVAPAGLAGIEWRRTLSRRATDLHVARATGVTPLSVAADRIAAVAMRAAGLLSALAAAGEGVDRAGGGRVVEVYPAAALARWGLPHTGYKGSARRQSLGEQVDALVRRMPGLDLGAAESLCRRSDDAFDAVVCALVARAAALGLAEDPAPEQRARAATEGWILLPTSGLTDLVATGHRGRTS
jgi:predicted nuclease with RNAse H fold